MKKICTSLEQSKKLKELGINRKTSDMYYWCGEDLRIGGYRAQDEEYDIPAWSLTALLGVLPDYTLQTNRDGTVFVVCESEKPMISDAYDNPIDAVFEMVVVWLNENNKI